MNPLSTVGLAIAVFVGSLVGTKFFLGLLTRRAIFDRPNERSSHSTPVPTGGGVVVCAAGFSAWALIGLGFVGAAAPVLIVCGLAAGLAIISWIDDLSGLNQAIRLIAQIAAIGISLAALPAPGPFFGGVFPVSLDYAAAGLIWLWFTNL